MTTTSKRLVVLAAAFGLVTGCAEGKNPPEVTDMVPVTSDLTFYIGDAQPCTVFGDAPYECGAVCSEADDTGCVGVSGLGPPTQVEVEAFCIDEHEVTNLQYLFCEEMGACPRRPFDNLGNQILDYGQSSQYNSFPANVINYAAAEAYCEFVGKRLPTAFEWERVAGGPAQSPDLSDKRLYPYLPVGETDPEQCRGQSIAINLCLDQSTGATREVKTSTSDFVEVNGRQVWDLGGNFREWTSTPFSNELARDELGLTCGSDSRAQCTSDIANFPDCGPGESPQTANCCACGDNGEPCYRICQGSGSELAVCVRRFPEGQTVSQNDEAWLPSDLANSHVIKGGSYDLTDTLICNSRTSAWSFQFDVQETQLSVGLRCAADFGSAACPAQ